MNDDKDEEGDAADPEAPVTLPIEDVLDLHPFAPRDIASVVEEYVEAAWAKGLAEVRLVHGRGVGVQRETVRKVLARHPRVASFTDAPAHLGGWGATVARLWAADP